MDIIVEIIAQNAFDNQIYNVVSDKKFFKQAFYQKIADELNHPFVSLKSKKSFIKVISNDKVRKELNYKFKHSDILQKVLKSISKSHG